MKTNKLFHIMAFKWLFFVFLIASQVQLFGQLITKNKNYRLSNVLKTCETWNIANNTGALIRVNYADCNLNVSTIDIPSGGQPRQICVVTNDFYTQGIGGVTSYPDNTPIQSVPNVATGSGGSCLPVDPCADVTANWVLTGNTRCTGNDRESEYHDNNTSCTNNQNYWAVTTVNGCYIDPCAGVVANWVLTGNTRCNGNDRESEYHDNNISCTNNQNYWTVTTVNGCYVDPCAGVTANWVLTGSTRCVGNDRESEYHDNNISCTNNQNYWTVTTVNGCYVDPCAGVTANWILTGNTRCVGNDRESEYHDNSISCTNNQNYWAVSSVNGCYVDPCTGVTANWVLTGNTRCNGNDRESEYQDNNISCTNNQNYWTVTTVNGCYVDPCAGVTANWVLTGNTRCNGNDRESEYHDNNISCTNNQNYWAVTTINGCYVDPCAGVTANWVLTGNTRCNGNDRESEYHDNNISCTNNQNYWAVTTVNGCYVDPCAGVAANWVLTGNTRCNGNDRESEYHDNNISCTNNQNYWAVTTVNGCYIDPCAGITANWVLTENTRCNGNDRESEYHDNNISCTNNQNYWAITTVNGCYIDPCAGVTANWVLTGNTRCTGNDRESEYHDNNISCTNNQNYWAVTTVNGCYVDPCAGVKANWVLTENTRCNGNDRESEYHDNNISCTNNQNYWAVTTINGCYVDPCAGITANWVLTGNTRCNGNDRESEYHDNNISCTNNQNYWAITTVNGCYIDPCTGVTANWVLTGSTRCNGNDRESEYHDNNISCTNNQNYWAVTTVNGCYLDPCVGVVANWVLTGSTRCNGNDSESEYHDNNISCTNNQNYWAITTVNGCYIDPCAGVTANWVLTGNTRCTGNDRESEYHDNNISCTNNQNYWAVTTVNGCYIDPCAGVTAKWVLTGNTRCNGNDRESEYHDNNISCTNNQNYWAVTTVNGCYIDPCAGVVANWIDTGQNRCTGFASEKEIKDLNSNCTKNTNRWIVVNPNGCNPCYGVVAKWEGTGDTRCKGDAKERRRQDLNKNCTGNEDVWDEIDTHGCNPCFGVVADWEGTGDTRCNGDAKERRRQDLNRNCTGNEDVWDVIEPNGCNPCFGVVAKWEGTGDTRCNGDAKERRRQDLNKNCTGNVDVWDVIEPNGCNPCFGVVANWEGTGETRCKNNNLERKSIDLNNSCTKNNDRWDIIEINGCLVETPTGTIKWNNPTDKVVQNPIWNDTQMDVCFGDTVKVEAQNQALNDIEWQIDSTLSLFGASYVNILSDVNAENFRTYKYRAVKTTSTGILAYSDWGIPLIARVRSNPNKPIISDVNICPGKIARLFGSSDSTSLAFDFGQLIPVETNSELGKISAQIKPDSTGNYKLKSTNIYGCSSETEFKVNVFEAPLKPTITAIDTLLKYGETSTLSVENCNGIVNWENGKTGNSLEINPKQSSNFKAKCITLNGCESDLVEIQIAVLPQIPEIIGSTKLLDGMEIKATEHIICESDFISLSNTTDFKGKVNWYADGVKMDSMSTGFYPNKNMLITAKSVNDAGESDESNAIKITTRSSELLDDLVVVYPNPTSDKVKIRSENCMKGIKLKLFTLLGQEIYNNSGTSFQGNELIFDISTLPTSQYILKIYNDQNQVIGRRIIKGGNALN